MPEKNFELLNKEQQQEIFEKARGYVEKIVPLLEDCETNVEGMVVQILISRFGLRIGQTPQVVLQVLAANVPMLMAMLEKAYEAAAAEEQQEEKQ